MAIALVGEAASLLSGLFSAFAEQKAGEKEKEAHDYNALIADSEAINIRESAKLDEFRERKSLKAFVGQQISGYAASGVEMTGSPLDVIRDTVANAELEIAIGKYNSEILARQKESEASRSREYGTISRDTARTQATSTFLGSLFDTGTKFYGGSSKSKTKIGA